MRLKLFYLAAGAALILAAMPLLAHHSFAAEYDINKPCKMTGTITKFDLANPHSWIHVDVKDADGNVVNWAFETASPSNLYRRGFRKSSLTPGIVVTIEGYLAKDGSHTGNCQKLTYADGTTVVMGTEQNPG
jgi:hypothetical protein